MLKTFTLLFSAAAVLTVPAAAKAKLTCELIDRAISANEDFVEVVLGVDQSARADAQAAVHRSFEKVAQDMSPAAQVVSKKFIAALDKALVTGDSAGAALAAVENYGVFVKVFEARLATTYDAAMLDYAGFKLHSLLAAQSVDWVKLEATVAETTEHWNKAGLDKGQKALSDLMHNLLASLDEAAGARNPQWLHSSAQILLDSVDLVEGVIKNPAAEACS